MKTVFLSALTLIVLSLTGCGSGSGHHSDPPPLFPAQILSDAALDGDIAKSVGGIPATITQGAAESYYAGFDPADRTEFRAFLQFPLGGAGGVPAGAIIQSAILDLLINSIQPNPLLNTIPIRIDLVDLQPTTLFLDDFDRTLQPALEQSRQIAAQALTRMKLMEHVFLKCDLKDLKFKDAIVQEDKISIQVYTEGESAILFQ